MGNISDSTNMIPKKLSENLSRENPLPGQHYFDPRIADLSAEQGGTGSLGRDDNWFTNHQNYGIGQNELAADYSNDPMVKAIEGGWDHEYNESSSGLRTRNELNSKMMESQQKSKAANQVGALEQNENQNFQDQYAYQLKRHAMLNQYKIAKARAEAGLYGAMFSGIATVGAALIGGGGGSGGGYGQGRTGGGSNNTTTQPIGDYAGD